MGSIILSVMVVVIGLAIGLARGGQLDGLASVRPRWWGLIVLGFAIHALAESFDVPGAVSLSIIGMFLLVVGLGANVPTIAGAGVTAVGVAMNLVPLVLNGAVPVRFEALRDAGIVADTTTQAQVTSVGHLLELETDGSRLGDLGDVIPISFVSSVISIGDLVTFAGVIVIVSGLVAARRRGGIHVDDLFAPQPPVTIDLLDLDTPPAEATLDPYIDLTGSQPSPAPAVIDTRTLPAETVPPETVPPETVQSEIAAYDPDDLWADDPAEGVKILGPSSKTS